MPPIDAWQFSLANASLPSERQQIDKRRTLTPQVAADQIVAILSSTERSTDRYQWDLKWLAQRKKIWVRTSVRLGVFGITSSGKSTLLNALMGEEVLPAGVRPSTNCIVLCRSGRRLEAAVRYSDGKVKKSTGKGVAKLLAQVGDERATATGREVEEIELRAPRLLFPDDVTLIDSPGLDAWDLLRHEDLSLRFLLPTVDVALFVVTCKVGMDAKILEYLDQIGEEDKPLVLAQNMVDSVQAKRGVGGRIEVDRHDVAAQYLRRLGKTLDKSAYPRVRDAEVHQVSAQLGLTSEGGGVPQLAATLREKLDELRPSVEWGRWTQLRRRIKRLVDIGAPSEDGSAARSPQIESEVQQLTKLRKEVHRAGRSIRDRCQRAKKTSETKGADYSARADGLTNGATARERNLRKEVNNWIAVSPRPLEKAWREVFPLFSDVAKELNLRVEDLETIRFQPRIRAVAPHSYHTPVRYKTQGVFAEIGRRVLGRGKKLVGGKYRIDANETKRDVARAVAGVQSWINATAKKLKSAGAAQAGPLLREIDHRLAALDLEQTRALESQEQARIVDGLRRLLESWPPPPEPGAATDAGDVRESRWSARGTNRVEVAPAVLDVLGLTQRLLDLRHLVARNAVLERVRPRPRGREGTLLVLGRDPDALERFAARFWWDRTATLEWDEGGVARTLDTDALFVDEPRWLAARGKDPRTRGKQPKDTSAVFVLVDIVQQGSTAMWLSQSPWIEGLGSCDIPVVLVVESIAELVIADALVEGWSGFKALWPYVGCQPVGVLVNDRSVAYSVLFDAAATGRLSGPRSEGEMASVLQRLGTGLEPSKQFNRAVRGIREGEAEP